MKLAFVVQRYGPDIAGGSEAHCRDLALRLSAPYQTTAGTRPAHDVTVLTTCARDYVSWANEFAPGPSADGAVRVLRFPVRHTRRRMAFAELSDEVFDGGASPARQEEWFRENGPDAPELLEHLAAQGSRYDAVLFWTFRYATSYFGLPLVARRSILLPTAEDDPAVRLDVLQQYFQKPAAFLFLTPEEQALIETYAGVTRVPFGVVGAGLDPPAPVNATLLREAAVVGDYVLYLGRVDRNKGCHTLLEYFEQYASRQQAGGISRRPLSLVLAGPAKMRIPDHSRIRALGYVPGALRDALLASACALVVPSRYESLSMVLLEGWNHSRPALVNGGCRVLDGQVRRANGGLAYRSADEFAEALDYLLQHPAARDAFGRQGLAYVEREYRWPTVLARVERVLEQVSRT